jgi:menaquinol-cytochrome c reductase iron-sulfur subunit
MSHSENSATPPDEPAIAGLTPEDGHTSESPRRNFMAEFFAVAIGGLVGLVPVVTGMLFFLDPLLRKKPQQEPGSGGVVKDEEGYILLDVTVDDLPADGTPQRFTVRDDIVDAWNKFPNQPIGSVWLRRISSATPPVIAFNTICPHLGCSVDHRPAEGDFYCPCHTSAFTLDGTPTNDIPPRAMDDLHVKVTGSQVWLKYQAFRGAIQEKVEV